MLFLNSITPQLRKSHALSVGVTFRGPIIDGTLSLREVLLRLKQCCPLAYLKGVKRTLLEHGPASSFKQWLYINSLPSVCLFVCVYVCVCLSLCLRLCICLSLSICVSFSVCLCASLSVCLSVCLSLSLSLSL